MLWFQSWNPLEIDGTLLSKKAAGEFTVQWVERGKDLNEYIMEHRGCSSHREKPQCYTEESAEEPSQAHYRGSKIRG